jgi:hypothetical protein
VHAYQSVRVIYQSMNTVVVSLMQSADRVTNRERGDDNEMPDSPLLLASERAVVAYCQFYRLLLSPAGSERMVLREATLRIRRFLSDPKTRTKTHVPDMGELIVMASVVQGCSLTVGGCQPMPPQRTRA